MSRAPVVLLALAFAALLGSADGGAVSTQVPVLHGTVGPEMTITLVDAQGNAVTKLDPGQYRIEVEDRSEFHSFHLLGPGVNERTTIADEASVVWTVSFTDGTYSYYCDAHGSMLGRFVVGSPPTPKPPPSNVVTPKTRLVLTAGPAQVITLKTAAGKVVKQLKKGTYTVTVRDRSRDHNARITAPGYSRATTVPFVGTQTWKVRLARTGTLRYRCDPHASFGMRGSAKIVA
jgi:plastocyanin